MTTLGDLISSVHNALHSYTGLQERSTWLSAAVTDSDLVFPVASAETIFRGVTEVGDELIYVDSTDSTGLVLAPFGRGYRGSTAAAHDENTQVTFDPVFPRYEIKNQINRCIDALYPSLWQTKTEDLDYSVEPIGYELAADVEKVLEVKTKRTDDPLNYWYPVHHWAFDPNSPETSGKAFNLLQNLQPGSTIRIVYSARFGNLTDDADTLADAGLEENYRDLIMYGVAAHMVRFLDPARLQVSTVENLSRSSSVQAGDAGRVANQLYAMYQQRLAEERKRLLSLTPPSIHFTR